MTRAKASSPISWPRRCRWWSATRAATTPATPSWSTARPSPCSWSRAAILYDHITPVIGNGVVVDPTVLLAEVDTLAAKGVDTVAAAGQRQRPPDHAVPPRARPADRALPGQEQPGHDPAGHRPGLRGQGRPGRAARPGPPRPEDLPPEARRGPQGEERRPGQGVQPPAARRPTTSPPSTSTSWPPGWPRWWPTPWAWSTTPSIAAHTCCSRGPRPPSSISTTGPIPSSPRPTRWPAAPARAPGSGPATSTRSSASPRRT